MTAGSGSRYLWTRAVQTRHRASPLAHVATRQVRWPAVQRRHQYIGSPDRSGRQELQATTLSSDLFKASNMKAVFKDLLNMKVDELKQELEKREDNARRAHRATRRGCGGGSTVHAAIVREYLEGE